MSAVSASPIIAVMTRKRNEPHDIKPGGPLAHSLRLVMSCGLSYVFAGKRKRTSEGLRVRMDFWTASYDQALCSYGTVKSCCACLFFLLVVTER